MTAWPQLIGASRAKDSLENTLHSMVCADQITLAGAQRAIRTNWAAGRLSPVCDATGRAEHGSRPSSGSLTFSRAAPGPPRATRSPMVENAMNLANSAATAITVRAA